jgi:BirA family biotin operon repressor/biotin-[acetyl-CoA-carboxylase] ligase
MIIKKLSSETREYADIGSTNGEMNRLLGIERLAEGTVVRAGYQSAGRGHGGNTWSSERGKNLLFSLLLRPVSLPLESVFNLSRITSLSLVEVLDKHAVKCVIKWPNDILAGTRKIAGILIDNSIVGGRISHSVIGVGWNVNQAGFDAGIPDPTSMFLEKGCQFDMDLLLGEFRAALEGWYRVMLAGDSDRIMETYHTRLHLLGTPARFSDGKDIFVGRIRGVLPDGELELEREGGEVCRYAFKEIEYLD